MATNVVLVADQAKLMRREEVAEGTMAFHFEKPSGFRFKAGQSADVTLTDPPETDAEGNAREFCFSRRRKALPTPRLSAAPDNPCTICDNGSEHREIIAKSEQL